MTREIIEITSEAQWLELRKRDITSTSMAALLELSPYSTPFEVYHAHKSGVQVPFDPTERMEKGKRMEAYIAQEIAIKNDWIVRPLNVYARIPELRMGASFDFEYTKPCGTKGIMEIKGVDYFQHKETWELPEDGGEATPYVEIQVQHQLECIDQYEEATIVAATSIYDFHEYHRPRDREFGADLKIAVKKFWDDVEAGNEPKPNFYRDSDIFAELYKNAEGEPIDKTTDDHFDSLCSRYARLSAEGMQNEKEKQAAKAEIHSILANNGGAYSKHFKVIAGWTKDSSGTLITSDMVGTTTGARRGYRQCLVKALK